MKLHVAGCKGDNCLLNHSVHIQMVVARVFPFVVRSLGSFAHER